MSQTEAFKVCVRIRPLNSREEEIPANQKKRISQKVISDNEIQCKVECPSLSSIQVEPEQKHFIFDNVFDESVSTEEMYSKQIQPILQESISKGYNTTIFAYGMTGAGKSFTMFGDLLSEDETINLQRGIISLCVQQIFQDTNVLKIGMSFLEIYNEQLRDLICDTPQASLMIVDDTQRGVIVQDALEIEVSNPQQIRHLLQIGSQRRVMAATHANQVSSRSHAILQFMVVSEKYTTKLSLVDLAGSERASVSDNRGLRQQEGANINRSLLALGNCINVLSDRGSNNTKKFVPYRDSKLTRLLKDALGGSTRTVMVACVSPSVHCHDETLNTLKYASRARAIKKRVLQNEKIVVDLLGSNGTQILKLKQEVNFLREIISKKELKVYSQDTSTCKSLLEKLNDTMDQIQNLKVQQIEETSKIINQDGIKKGFHTSRYIDDFKLQEQIVSQEFKRQEYEIHPKLEELIKKQKILHIEKQRIEQSILQLFEQQDQLIQQQQRELEAFRIMNRLNTDRSDIQTPSVHHQSLNTNIECVSPEKTPFTKINRTEVITLGTFTESKKMLIPPEHIQIMNPQHRKIDSLDLECQNNFLQNDIAEDTPCQGFGLGLQQNSSVNPLQATGRDSRKTSWVSQPPSKQSHQTERINNSGRKSQEQQIGLMQLNEARNNYKVFRSKLYQMKDDLEKQLDGQSIITDEQAMTLKNLLQEIHDNKHVICNQDLILFQLFEKLIEKYNQSKQQAIVQHSNQVSANNQSRSKSATVSRNKNSRSTNPRNQYRNQIQQPIIQQSKERSPQRPKVRGIISNQNKNYAQAVCNAKKSSVSRQKENTPMTSSQAFNVPKYKNQYINENGVCLMKNPLNKPPKTQVQRGMSNSTMQPLNNIQNISPIYSKQNQSSFTSIIDENPDIQKHYQRQLYFPDQQNNYRYIQFPNHQEQVKGTSTQRTNIFYNHMNQFTSD